MSFSNSELLNSLQAGFVDKNISSRGDLMPSLLINDKPTERKVLTTILHELRNCESFWFSVAFVTTGGVASLINTLLDLEERNIKGKILVSQYLNFTHPEALRRLRRLRNIELRINTTSNFHSKGYLFKHKTHYNLIIGSSNLTSDALSVNNELNIKTSATKDSFIISKVFENFTLNFERSVLVDENYIRAYSQVYLNNQLVQRARIKEYNERIRPNRMQVDALNNLNRLRKEGKTKALLISATGTGKTFLSAFDVKQFKAKRFLFIVHRRNIAEKAMESFKTILGDQISMGIFSGSEKEIGKEYIFSTIQTLAKLENLNFFKKTQFDYIVIDETHRAGAESYKRILEYFQPTFLLGMTATPERTDGHDIFKYFDYNIAYEIRLQKALEERMLATFHYYGVSDISVGGKLLEKDASFSLLTSKERVNKILAKSKLYSSDNGIIRGLVFCSRKEECINLSEQFNKLGYKTIALTDKNSENERSEAIFRLESDGSDRIDYIFTVDIFNEGVDIPRVNQIIMLRPTQSAIIFVQQLGRGLRKTEGKDYLTVIDFIGNYANNYLVPIALYGDSTYNKDNLRKLISSESALIPGDSTINFDKIAKEKIFEAINKSNLSLLTDLKKDYDLLKFKIGRIPMMVDFINSGSRDPMQYVEYSKSYFNFIIRSDSKFTSSLNKIQIRLLELFSSEVNNGKRIIESVILKHILNNGSVNIKDLLSELKNQYNYKPSFESICSAVRNINFEFITENRNKKVIPVSQNLGIIVCTIKNEIIRITQEFKDLLNNSQFLEYLLDSTTYSILIINQLTNKHPFVGDFLLYNKYSRKDVFRILNWISNPIPQNVGGYMISSDKSNCPIFVTYDKHEGISSSTKYEDKFLTPHLFQWMTKSKRTFSSPDVIFFKNWKQGIQIPLFVKKSDDEGTEFYFMGYITPQKDSFEQLYLKNDEGKDVPVIKIDFIMDIPVSDSIYNYLLGNE